MANEKRLIDANELAEQVDNLCADWNENWIGNDNQSFILHSDVSDLISDAPTVDAVEVVRCKDCKKCGVLEHNGKLYCTEPMGCFGCVPTKPDNFCSYGERKNDETSR